jgi:hypothetical protein
MISKTSHLIKNRTTSNDIFLTPIKLAKFHISSIKGKSDDIWFDPFRNNGNYYNNYPTIMKNRRWTEILKGRDFFTCNFEKNMIICSNPPYSCLDRIITKFIELEPKIISILIGVGNLTARRIEVLENAGYKIIFLHMCKVYKFYGMSYIVTFEKTDKESIMSYDRTVWREE